MYPTSAAVRWVFSGTYCQPAWNTASNVWNSSTELRVRVATGSRSCTPRARRACTRRSAPESSSPAVHARSSASINATRAGSSRAAIQNPLGTCSSTRPPRSRGGQSRAPARPAPPGSVTRAYHLENCGNHAAVASSISSVMTAMAS